MPIAFASIARMIGIKGFLSIGLGLALAITMWRADTISGQRDKFRDAFIGEQTRHAVTRASLDKLTIRLEAMVADGKAREKRAAQALHAQKQRSAVLDGQIGRIRSERLKPAPVGQECKSPESVLAADGL